MNLKQVSLERWLGFIRLGRLVGDTVFLKKTPDVENGKIAAVLIDNEATLKKVIKTNDVIILQPCNSNSNLYKPILLDGKEDTMILGEMVGVYHPYKK